MRRALVILHRWFGLFTALFLFIAGITGAVISWDHELDAWLNPHLHEAKSSGKHLPTLTLAERLETADPRLRVRYMPLATEPGKTFVVSVAPRMDPSSGKPFELDFDQVALDPTTGAVQGRRMWGEASLSRENLMPFLYKLHYSLHIPRAFDLELGMLLMGIIAVIWTFDSLIALWISFPNRKSWRKSFQFRLRSGAPKLTFDLHRSSGVWLFPLLLMLAITGVSMNLNREVMRPLVELFSTLSPNPFALRTPAPPDKPIEPVQTREQILELAGLQGKEQAFQAPPGGIFYAPDYGVYGVGFFKPGLDHGDGGLGNPWLYFDGKTGASAGHHIPGTGSAGDIFIQAQFPLHSGRIFGVPGRVAISALGLIVAMLSVTGVLIWARKRRARALQVSQTSSPLIAVREELSG